LELEVEGVRLSVVRSAVELFGPREWWFVLGGGSADGLSLEQGRLSLVSSLAVDASECLSRVGRVQVATSGNLVAWISQGKRISFPVVASHDVYVLLKGRDVSLVAVDVSG